MGSLIGERGTCQKEKRGELSCHKAAGRDIDGGGPAYHLKTDQPGDELRPADGFRTLTKNFNGATHRRSSAQN